jgi:hypothetical protein
VTTTKQEEPIPGRERVLLEQEARAVAIRENAKQVLQESGLAALLQTINKDELRRRGTFEEYDSLLLLRWGTGYTRRHLWIEVNGNTIRFRLAPHRKCNRDMPLCDGEYHTFTSTMWADPDFLRDELYKYYRKPVAESSSD